MARGAISHRCFCRPAGAHSVGMGVVAAHLAARQQRPPSPPRRNCVAAAATSHRVSVRPNTCTHTVADAMAHATAFARTDPEPYSGTDTGNGAVA